MYIIMESKACMPASCKFGDYRKVAVIETDGINMPKQIHPKHKSVKRIVQVWDKVNRGKTENCGYEIAKRKAIELCNTLNLSK